MIQNSAAMAVIKKTNKMVLFDSHCHLQDPRIYKFAPQIITTAINSGVLRFAVNGVSEKDWHVVKQMNEDYPSSVIPCFGLHPWYVLERTPNWFNTLKDLLNSTPSASVGEIGLDKGSRGKQIDFIDQVDVFRQQLQLSKDLNKPASIHCVRAFGDLLEIMQSIGPFPAGVILHSYVGSAEMVPTFAKLGAYFSFSGFLMDLKPQKAKKMVKSVPTERILLESDAPDALPKSDVGSLVLVQGDASVREQLQHQETDASDSSNSSDQTLPKETLNQPVNVHAVLNFVALLLEMPEEEVAEISYRNAIRLFSYPGSKVIDG